MTMINLMFTEEKKGNAGVEAFRTDARFTRINSNPPNPKL